MCFCLSPSGRLSHLWASKGKVDNLYRGSKWSRSLQNRCYNTPLFIGPHVKWLPHTDALTWKPSQGTNLPNYTAWWTEAHWCEQLAQGRCPTMQRPGIEPTICPSRVQRPNHCATDPPHTSTHETAVLRVAVGLADIDCWCTWFTGNGGNDFTLSSPHSWCLS